MIRVIIVLWVREALALCRQRVDDHRPVIDLLCLLKSTHEVRNVMPVNISDIFKAQFIDQRARQDSRGNSVFYRLRRRAQLTADTGNALKSVADLFLQMLVALRLFDPVQITAQRSNCRRDRHSVVVEQDDHPGLQMSCLVDRLHRHATGEARIAYQRANMKILLLCVASHRHAQRRRERGRRVAGTKGVVLRLVTPQEAAQTAVLLDRVQFITTSRQDLMCIGLMPDVPYKFVVGGIEYVMHRNRQLYGTKRRAGVSAYTGAGVDNELSDLVGDLLKVL